MEMVDAIRKSPAVDSLFFCPLSTCSLIGPIYEPSTFICHLREEHSVEILNPASVIPYLQRYVDHYLSEGYFQYNHGPLTLSCDEPLRRRLHQEKLCLILSIQEKERGFDHLQSKKCLFCSVLCGTKAALFKHMFDGHGFNIGLLDNLVEVDEFLDLLDRKLKRLECLFCQKIFKSHAVLRRHMRKKKHFKIHPKNHIYDKYYVINFVVTKGLRGLFDV